MCFVGLSVCVSVFTLGRAQFHGCPSPALSVVFLYSLMLANLIVDQLNVDFSGLIWLYLVEGQYERGDLFIEHSEFEYGVAFQG